MNTLKECDSCKKLTRHVITSRVIDDSGQRTLILCLACFEDQHDSVGVRNPDDYLKETTDDQA